MAFLWWFIIIILFILSFIGIVLPVIPGSPMILIGFLIYHFGIAKITSLSFWITVVVITIFTFIIDYLASSSWVRRYGGSKAGAWSAIGGVLLGPFIMGPLGIIIGPFIFVTITEMLMGYKFEKAIKIGFASFVGFIGGSILKGFLHLIMIIMFFFVI